MRHSALLTFLLGFDHTLPPPTASASLLFGALSMCVCVSRYRGTKINGNKELSCSELLQFEYCKGPHMRSRVSRNFCSSGNLEAKLSDGSTWFEIDFGLAFSIQIFISATSE